MRWMTDPRRWLWFGLTAAAVIALDQLTKQLAVNSVDVGEARHVLPGIEIAHVHNRGVAFGLMSGGAFPIILFTSLAIGALALYFAANARRPYLWLVAGLLTGGAVANLIDRLRQGYVTDFIDLPAWPTFNIADIAIVAGAAGLAMLLMFGQGDRQHD